MPPPNENGWSEWKQRVLYQLEQQAKDTRSLSDQVRDVQISVAKLQIKAGVWGAAAGAVPAILYLVLQLMK